MSQAILNAICGLETLQGNTEETPEGDAIEWEITQAIICLERALTKAKAAE